MNTIEYNADGRHITDDQLNDVLVKHGIDHVRVKLCFLAATYCYNSEAWNVNLCIMIGSNSFVMMHQTADKELINAYKTSNEGYLKLLNIVLEDGIGYVLSRFMGPFEYVQGHKRMGI